jgi:hypothetical protein
VRTIGPLAQRYDHVGGGDLVKVGNFGCDVTGVDERAGVRVSQDPPDLVAYQAVIDVYGHESTEQTPHVRLHGLHPVAHHERDVVTGREPLAGERVGEPGRVLQHLPVGHHLAMGAQRHPLPGPSQRPGQHGSDRLSRHRPLRRHPARGSARRAAVV